MNTLIVTEVKIFLQDGKYFCSESFSKILERYCEKFGNISVLTRIVNGNIPKGYIDISNYGIDFYNSKSIISSINPIGKKNVKDIVKKNDFIILRVPSVISIYLVKLIKKYKKTYMTEVMGCAWDAYWNHGIIGKIIAPIGFIKMKNIVYKANYSIYVTNLFLQKRYPCKNRTIGVSNVNISSVQRIKDYKTFDNNSFSMLTAAAVDVRYKGQQYVIKAIAKLKKENISIKYFLAGGGNQNYLKKMSKKYKVEENVVFLGNLPHYELLKYMSNIDFYIQPSLQEGLPRAVIEAMSCGRVCLGSTTAGIPELLDSRQLFKRHSVKSIIKTIKQNLTYDLDIISKRNLERAKEYISDSLDARRFDFFEYIKKDIDDRM